jgi:hypothetical protein
MCVCVCVCVCVCDKLVSCTVHYVCVCQCVGVGVGMIFVCMYVCMHVGRWVGICVCLCVCVYYEYKTNTIYLKCVTIRKIYRMTYCIYIVYISMSSYHVHTFICSINSKICIKYLTQFNSTIPQNILMLAYVS